MLSDKIYKMFRGIALVCIFICMGTAISLGYNTLTGQGDVTFQIVGIIMMIVSLFMMGIGILVKLGSNP